MAFLTKPFFCLQMLEGFFLFEVVRPSPMVAVLTTSKLFFHHFSYISCSSKDFYAFFCEAIFDFIRMKPEGWLKEMKAAEGSLLSSDVFVSSVRTAIGQFILMISIFHLFISKKSKKNLEIPKKLHIFAPSQSPITTMGCWDNQLVILNGLIERWECEDSEWVRQNEPFSSNEPSDAPLLHPGVRCRRHFAGRVGAPFGKTHGWWNARCAE